MSRSSNISATEISNTLWSPDSGVVFSATDFVVRESVATRGPRPYLFSNMSTQTSPNLITDEPQAVHRPSGLVRPCTFCHKAEAVWSYMPGSDDACDDCVPRGCSCNADPKPGKEDSADPADYVEQLDEKGRRFPCCEWMGILPEADPVPASA